MNRLLLTLFGCLYFFGINAQTLKTDNIDLNPGGIVYDIAYDEYSNAFIVVGSFTSINGVARTNLAMIDATTYTVQTESPITSINGAIRSVELVRKINAFPIANRNYLYLGGEFTQINGQTKNYLALMIKVEPVSPPFNSTFNLTTGWNAEILDLSDPTHHINDIDVHGDTVIAVGMFGVYSGFTSYTIGNDFGGVIAFQSGINTFNYNNHFENFAQSSLVNEQYYIDFFGGQYYLSGSLGFKKFSSNGSYISDFQNCSTGSSYTFDIHPSSGDTLVLTRVKYATGEGISIYQMDGNMINCPFNNQITPLFKNGALTANGFIETYKDQVFIAENNQLLSYDRTNTSSLQPTQILPANANWYSYIASGWRPPKLRVVADKLFMFGNNLTQVNGASHIGLAALCLSPKNAADFTNYDTTICENDFATYTIPAAQYATGYKWTYSGTGALYRVAGTGNPLQSLNANYINGTNANSLEIHFPQGTSSGTLTVEPYSTCNSPTDYMISSGKSKAINVVALPQITMADSTFLNCYSDTAWITFNSLTPNITPYIYRGIDTTWNDSVMIEIGMPITAGYYYGVVTEPINQCSMSDSSWFDFDLTPPAFTSNDIVSSPAEFNCNSTSMQINANLIGASITWNYDLDPTIPLPNPFTIYSTDSTMFTATAMKLSNGCTQDQQFQVQVNQTYASDTVLSYTNYGAIPLDSLSCLNPNLTLECGVNPPLDGTASWLIGNTPTGSEFLNLSAADTIGLSGQYKVYRFITTHNVSGCIDTANVVIQFDFDIPFVVNHNGNESLNCSQDSALIVHQSSGNPIEGWLDQFGTQTFNDTLIASNTGDYYYQVQSANGCLNTDTVTVSQTLSMSVQLPSDTLICPGEVVTLTAVPIINTGETPTFLWSNGSTSNSTSATGGTDTQLSVIVQTTSGCIGYDTTNILINPPVIATFSSSSGCTNAVVQVTSVTGGSGNYEYSLDQFNWQVTPAFTGLNPGTYDIFVRDDLGCVYGFTETIDPSQSSVPINFLAPTYNELNDTAVVINYGSFAGFDSLTWVTPNGAFIAFESDTMLAFSMATEGWHDVTLIGFLDTCQYSITHSLYFGEKPVFTDSLTSLGIQSLIVYPNPTTGNFTLEAELGVEQNYTILVSNTSGQPIPSMTVNGVGMLINHSFSFPISATPGAYILHFVADYDLRQETIILN